MGNEQLFIQFARALVDVLGPLEESLANEQAFGALLLEEGWLPPDQPGYLASARAAFDISADVQNIAAAVEELVHDTEPSLSDAVDVLAASAALIQRLRSLAPPAGALPPPLDSNAFWQSFPREVVEKLLARYLATAHPGIYAPLHLIGLIEETFVPA